MVSRKFSKSRKSRGSTNVQILGKEGNVQMAPNGSEKFQMAPHGFKLLQIVPIGHKWLQMEK